jgi:membrane peptidoglycan carboxypeptidase
MLGAQPVRPVDLAAFYAAIANEGMRPSPHSIDSIERNGVVVYRHDPKSSTMISSVDHAAFYQLKTIMQGVLARGTARVIADLAPYVAGKTGTSDDENDAWFVGFTNDVTVAVWIGYDNADTNRRTLGGGSTGAGVAVPLEPVIQAVWANVAPRRAPAVAGGCRHPHANRRSRIGELKERGRHHRMPAAWMTTQGINDTQARLVSGASGRVKRERDDADPPRRRLDARVHHRGNAREPSAANGASGSELDSSGTGGGRGPASEHDHQHRGRALCRGSKDAGSDGGCVEEGRR